MTGSASGMSQRLTQYFLDHGHYVCATDVRIDELKRQHEHNKYDGRLLVQKLDVCNPEDWDHCISKVLTTFGNIDLHFNIAGVLMPHKIQDATVREINLQIDVNVKGVVFGTRAIAKAMQNRTVGGQVGGQVGGRQVGGQQVGGHIVNFSSMGGLATVSGVTLYACSKFAVRGFSMACSKDLAEHGIAVTCFMPDAVQTPMVDLQLQMEESAMAFSGEILSLDQVEEAIVKEVILQRPVEFWLSSRARLARFGDIFGASRAVALAEWGMKRAVSGLVVFSKCIDVLTDVCIVVVGCAQGMAKQHKIKARLNDKEQAATIDGYGDGRSSIPDQRTISTRSNWPLKILTFVGIAWCAMVLHWWVKHSLEFLR